MSRNLERLGPDAEMRHDSIPVPQLTQEKTDLGFPQPTELVDLPTKGRFYPQGHPLHNVESIEIRYMTAKDEEILTSQTLIQKGVAIDKMLQGLILDKKIKIEDMFMGDRNAIAMAARITGYEAEYKAPITCPQCGNKAQHEFNLLEVKSKEAAEDVQISDDGTFSITLPGTEIVVELKMLTGVDEKGLKMAADKRRKHKMPESPLLDQLKAIIVSIDGDRDPHNVSKYIDTKLLAKHSKFIREEYARIVPNLDIEQDFECEACGTFSKVTIPFTGNFFWPKR